MNQSAVVEVEQRLGSGMAGFFLNSASVFPVPHGNVYAMLGRNGTGKSSARARSARRAEAAAGSVTGLGPLRQGACRRAHVAGRELRAGGSGGGEGDERGPSSLTSSAGTSS